MQAHEERSATVHALATGARHADQGLLRSLLRWLAAARQRRADRDQLAAMDDRELRDIGISRCHIDDVAAGRWLDENRRAAQSRPERRAPARLDREAA